MTLQLSLLAVVDDLYVGTARVNLSDPDLVVDRIEFFTTVLPGGPRSVAFQADRHPKVKIAEFDLLRDTSAQIKVEAVAVLATGGTFASTPAFIVFDPRSSVVAAPSLRSFTAFAQWWRIHVSCVPASAAAWKCWIRKNAWPTADNTPNGTLLNEYLAFEGHRDQLEFSIGTNTEGDTYNIVAAPFSIDGTMGQRMTDTVLSTFGPPNRVSLTPSVALATGVEQRIIINQDRLKQFTDWLTENNVKGFIGEFGWRNPPAGWNEVAQSVFAGFNTANLWATVWAVGEMWGEYELAPYVYAGGVYTERPQAAVLQETNNLTTPSYKRGVNVAGAEFTAPARYRRNLRIPEVNAIKARITAIIVSFFHGQNGNPRVCRPVTGCYGPC